jgi:hypothetical protein
MFGFAWETIIAGDERGLTMAESGCYGCSRMFEQKCLFCLWQLIREPDEGALD